MSETIEQGDRWLSVDTPLGQDVLLISGLNGVERMSRPFEFRLDLLSQDGSLKPSDILGKSVTVTIKRPSSDPRYINGIVRRFSVGPMATRDLRSYSAEIVPEFWLLSQTVDFKIFQSKTAVAIIEDVFKACSFTAYRKGAMNETHAEREYCVQYGESCLDFTQRLMQEEGIYYYFEHKDGEHTMVLSDHVSGYGDVDEEEVTYNTDTMLSRAVNNWRPRYEFQSGKWVQRDFDFENPGNVKSLEAESDTSVDVSAFSSYERFHYPGGYVQKSNGTMLTKVRMTELEGRYEIIDGDGDLASFYPGGKFTLKNEPVTGASNNQFVLTSVSHSASGGTLVSGMAGGESYSNSFSCVPADTVFRPARETPKPMVHGPQTAIVVGQSGQEIYCDKYGRVKVQFHWDRYGKSDENSSCWVRVAQMWSGKNWGTIFTPRVGMEVVVEFLDGDPDRPLVVGTVYNGDNGTPYTLDSNKTQSGILTRSSTGGSTDTANELRFEDKKGSEEIFFHAEKDFKREVENDDTLDVGNDQTITIENDRTETVKNDETITIENNRTETVKADETVTIEGDRSDTVQGDSSETIQGDATYDVTGDHALTVSSGDRKVTVSSGDDTLTANTGNITIKASAGKITMEAMQGIELKVGSNSVKIDMSGVTINGTLVKASATGAATLEGAMATVQGSGVLALKGGIIKIN